MKATELFIGALARVNRDGLCIKKGTIVEVRGIDADDKLIEKGLIGSAHCRPLDDNQFDGGIWCEYLDPIPIIPEILEKNGWKNISDHTLKGCDTFRLCLEQSSFDYTLTLKMRDYFRFDSYDDRVYTLCAVNFGFKYLHELQLAFRLCGIEKKIIL